MISILKQGFIFLIVSFNTLNAQVYHPFFEYSAAITGFTYQGDLTPSPIGSFKTSKPGVQLYAARILNRSMAVRLQFSIGSLKGDDSKYGQQEFRTERNFLFKTPLIELIPMIVWDPLRKNFTDWGFSTYIMGGGGLGLFRINRDWSRYNSDYFDATSDVSARLAIDLEHGTPRLLPVIPVGVGARYHITPGISVFLEAAYRFVFTDYLDGFSKSANPEFQDHYHTISLGVIYKPKRNSYNMACPVIRY